MHLGRAVLFLFCAASSSAAELSLSVKETAGVARSGEIVRSGVPLPRALSIATTDRLAILDADGLRVAGAARISGGALTAQIDGHDTALATIRRVAVEQSGPLVATVIVDGAYDLAPIGGGGIGSHRRYRFAAGSPTAIVEQSVTWEGDRCGVRGDIECNGVRNAVLVTRVRDTLISSGGVIAAIDHTQRYQPQAVAGDVIDLASDKVWLGSRQGLFATIAVSAVPGTEVSALLNHPLRATPDAAPF